MSTQKLQKKTDENTDRIREEIMKVGNSVRSKYPFLERNQDAIGLMILLTSFAATLFGMYCTIYNAFFPYWVNFLVVAISTSIIHEIEHDTIHNLFFNGSHINDFMLAICWIARPNTINPWTRRRLHFHHHKASGTVGDLEERGITNGQPWSPRRLLMLADAVAGALLRPIQLVEASKEYRLAQGKLTRSEKIFTVIENTCAYVPFGMMHYFMLHSFLAMHLINYWYDSPNAAATVLPVFVMEWMPVFTQYVWSLGIPNGFRFFCLVVVSSNMHYYGDIEAGDVHKQTQIWNTIWTLPLDLFTFNFGSTHAIHHFVTRDTFYIRQMMAPKLYGFLEKHGVRINDFDSFFRANRYTKSHREWHLL